MNEKKAEAGNIRSKALKWFEKTYGKIEKPVYATKLYSPSESWTKDYVWFVQVPIDNLTAAGIVNVLCQKSVNSEEFYHLRIPGSFLLLYINKFDRIKNALALYLSPKKHNFFSELRGKTNISFAKFLVK